MVGVASWIIQDGNYGDFKVGDETKFALEFYGSKLNPSTSRGAFVNYLGNGLYKVRAEVVYLDSVAWVIDFGFRTFWDSTPPKFASLGSWVEGEISIGIDPYFYMEHLYKNPGMPDLFYTWRINSILRDDTPWLVQVNEHGGKNYTRDEARIKWASVEYTDAWNDDEGRSTYLLAVKEYND
jgi:hypothetical protein